MHHSSKYCLWFPNLSCIFLWPFLYLYHNFSRSYNIHKSRLTSHTALISAREQRQKHENNDGYYKIGVRAVLGSVLVAASNIPGIFICLLAYYYLLCLYILWLMCLLVLFKSVCLMAKAVLYPGVCTIFCHIFRMAWY